MKRSKAWQTARLQTNGIAPICQSLCHPPSDQIPRPRSQAVPPQARTVSRQIADRPHSPCTKGPASPNAKSAVSRGPHLRPRVQDPRRGRHQRPLDRPHPRPDRTALGPTLLLPPVVGRPVILDRHPDAPHGPILPRACSAAKPPLAALAPNGARRAGYSAPARAPGERIAPESRASTRSCRGSFSSRSRTGANAARMAW